MELAGILPDIAHHSMLDDFRNFDPRDTKIVLLEGGPRLLTAFEPDLAARALRDLEGLGVEVHLNAVVTRIEKDAVYVGEQRIPTRTVLWAAGNQASPLARTLDAPLDRAGRVIVAAGSLGAGRAAHLHRGRSRGGAVQERACSCRRSRRRRIRMGKLAAKNISRLLADLPTLPFKYRDKGNLATIGRYRAIAEIGKVQAARPDRVVVLAAHPPHVSRDVPQSRHRADRVGVLVSHVSARLAAAHGARGRWRVERGRGHDGVDRVDGRTMS